MKGFKDLCRKIHSPTGLDSILKISLMRRLPEIKASDLLNGENLEVLILEFTQATVYLIAKGIDDQIEISFKTPYDFGNWINLQCTQKIFCKYLLSASAIKNDRGYYDALQLMFYPIDDITQCQILQLQVRASQFHLYSLQPMAWD